MAQTQAQFTANLKKYYSFYTGGFIAFVIVLAILEQMGYPTRSSATSSSPPPSASTPASAS